MKKQGRIPIQNSQTSLSTQVLVIITNGTSWETSFTKTLNQGKAEQKEQMNVKLTDNNKME